MRTLAGLMVVAATLTGTAASAEPRKLSDVDFLEAARCVGIASSGKIGSTDVPALNGWLRSQSTGRSIYIAERADQVQHDAKMEASRAGEFQKQRLINELNGVCATLRG